MKIQLKNWIFIYFGKFDAKIVFGNNLIFLQHFFSVQEVEPTTNPLPTALVASYFH